MLKKKTSGAYSSVTAVKKKVSGAWSDASTVYKKASGAWSLAWTPSWTFERAEGSTAWCTCTDTVAKITVVDNNYDYTTIKTPERPLKTGDVITVNVSALIKTNSTHTTKAYCYIVTNVYNALVSFTTAGTYTNQTYSHTITTNGNAYLRVQMYGTDDVPNRDAYIQINWVKINDYQVFPVQ